MRLKHVTITGADDNTDIKSLFELIKEYPFLEIGVLIARNEIGQAKYPSASWLIELAAQRKISDCHFDHCQTSETSDGEGEGERGGDNDNHDKNTTSKKKKKKKKIDKTDNKEENGTNNTTATANTNTTTTTPTDNKNNKNNKNNKTNNNNEEKEKEKSSKIIKIMNEHPHKFSAHICNEYAQELAQGSMSTWTELCSLPYFHQFSRIQLNFSRQIVNKTIQKNKLFNLLKFSHQEFVFQLPSFDEYSLVLEARDNGIKAFGFFDPSAGQGIFPKEWPDPPLYSTDKCNYIVGYAGGLGPHNLLSTLNILTSYSSLHQSSEKKEKHQNEKKDTEKAKEKDEGKQEEKQKKQNKQKKIEEKNEKDDDNDQKTDENKHAEKKEKEGKEKEKNGLHDDTREERGYWIDMETNVRTDGLFDLAKVRKCLDIAKPFLS